jgi:hypothetical protein
MSAALEDGRRRISQASARINFERILVSFSLIGRLGLDVSAYESALTKAERKGLEMRARVQRAQALDSMDPMIANAHGFKASAERSGSLSGDSFAQAFRDRVIAFLGVSGGRMGEFLGRLIRTPGAAGAGIAAGAVIAGNSLANSAVEEGRGIRIGAAELNLNSDDFQRLRHTFESVKKTADDAASSLEHLAEAQVRIRTHAPESAKDLEAFAALGVMPGTARTGSPMQILSRIGDNFRGRETIDQEEVAALRTLFGKSGVGMLPALKKGFDNPGASAGNYSPEDLQLLDKIKDEESTYKLTLRDYLTELKMWAARVKARLLGINKGTSWDDFKKQQEDAMARHQAGLQNRTEAFQQLDADAAAEKAAKLQKAADEEALRDASAAEELHKRNQERAEELAYRQMSRTQKREYLDAKIAELQERQKQIKLGELENSQKIAGLDSDIGTTTDAMRQKQIAGEDASAERDKLEQLKRARQDLQNNNAFLNKLYEETGSDLNDMKGARADFKIPKLQGTSLDPLAKIGGFGRGADAGNAKDYAKVVGLLERIEKNTKRKSFSFY